MDVADCLFTVRLDHNGGHPVLSMEQSCCILPEKIPDGCHFQILISHVDFLPRLVTGGRPDMGGESEGFVEIATRYHVKRVLESR